MNRVVRRWCVTFGIMGLVISPTWSQDGQDALPIIAPVKLLSSSGQSAGPRAMTAMAPADDGPRPTLPGGKLPQYQSARVSRVSIDAENLADARLRFVLALPARPVLIEAEITIDGRPFRMAREERITEVLAALRQPTSETTLRAESDESNAAEPDAADSAATPVDDEVDDAGEPEQKPVTPATVPAYSLASSATEYIRRYAAATGAEPTVDEVRWLLANWSDGPVLLALRENFQRFRAREQPVFDVLDRDRDGTISTAELGRAVESFNECDLNRDDVVDATEIAEVANDARSRASLESDLGVQLLEVSQEAAAESAIRRLAGRYEESPAELSWVMDGPPDVTLTVNFNTNDPARSTISVTNVNRDANGTAGVVAAGDSNIEVSLAGETVVFSAVQSGAGDQVSVGAVADGYPLLPEIDPNDDGRFTIREMRGLVDELKRLDRNGDGSLTADEARAPVRVCFGLGPIVHRELAAIRSRYRAPDTPVVDGPAWFVRMDRNRDRDLTRSEFPGTDEQFTALDADGDKLVSASEALEFDRASRDADATADPETPTASGSETE